MIKKNKKEKEFDLEEFVKKNKSDKKRYIISEAEKIKIPKSIKDKKPLKIYNLKNDDYKIGDILSMKKKGFGYPTKLITYPDAKILDAVTEYLSEYLDVNRFRSKRFTNKRQIQMIKSIYSLIKN